MSSLSLNKSSSASHVASETSPASAVSSTARSAADSTRRPRHRAEPVDGTQGRDLVPCDALHLRQLDVMRPLVPAAETERRAQDHHLAEAAGRVPERRAPPKPSQRRNSSGSARPKVVKMFIGSAFPPGEPSSTLVST